MITQWQLCICCPVLASAVVLGWVGPVPSLLNDSKSNVLNTIKCIVLSYTPSITKNLVYVSDTVDLFLLFWKLLQWFLLYSILYHHTSLFPEQLQFFVLSSCYLFCISLSRASYFLLPLELIYFIDCCIVASQEFLSFFLSSPLSCVRCLLDPVHFFLVCFPSPFWRCTPPDTSWVRFLETLISLVLECHKRPLICPHWWLIARFNIKSWLKIIWSQNVSTLLLSGV